MAITTPERAPSLRDYREQRGLSLRATAARADIDPAQLSRVERGQASLSVEALGRLARALGMDDFASTLSMFGSGESGP